MLIICLLATLLASNAISNASLSPTIMKTTNSENADNKYRESFINSRHENDLQLAEPQKDFQQIAISRQKLTSSRTVINGNHATYVEPPADFKPIIYEPEKQQTSNQNDRQSQPFDTVQLLPLASESFESPNQLAPSVLFPINTSGLSSQQNQYLLNHQQQQQRQRPQTADLVNSLDSPPSLTADLDRPSRVQLERPNSTQSEPSNNLSELSDKIGMQIDGEQNSSGSIPIQGHQSPMKESIGRWSDWHDMSIEPDLASSDSDLSPSASLFYAAANRYQDDPSIVSQFQIPIQSRYRTRYGATKSAVLPQQQSVANQIFYPHQVQLVQKHYLAEQINGVQQQQQQQQQAGALASQLEATGGTSERRRQSVANGSGAIKSASFHDDYPAYGAIKSVPLILVPSQAANLKNGANGLTKMQQHQQASHTGRHSVSQTSATSLPDVSSSVEPVQGRPSFGQQSKLLSQSKMAPNQQQRRRPKRRRKSKTNAEVRIHQLAAATKLAQQDLSVRPPGKQVNGLGADTGTAGASSSLPLINGQLQKLVQPLAARRQPERPIDGHQQLDERVFLPGRNRPAVIVRRFGGTSGPGANSRPATTNSTDTNVAKRTVRRRPLRTLLPVGLSSWFLGGIRDLDGRHWHLPAEVVSKLAINDVDLHHESGANLVPTESGFVSAEPNFQIVTSTQRVPISQLIPR